MVWEVLGSSKTQVRGYGIRAREEEEAPIIINEFSLEINKRRGITSLEDAIFWDEGRIGGGKTR
jgi:hypothetical protein